MALPRRPRIVIAAAVARTLLGKLHAEIIDPANRQSLRLRGLTGRAPRDPPQRSARRLVGEQQLLRRHDGPHGRWPTALWRCLQHYPETIRPALQVIAMPLNRGGYVIVTKKRFPVCLHSRETSIAAPRIWRRLPGPPRAVKSLGTEREWRAVVANFAALTTRLREKVRRATEIVKQRDPQAHGGWRDDDMVGGRRTSGRVPLLTLRQKLTLLVFPNLFEGA